TLLLVAVCFSFICFQSTKAAFGLQFQIGSPSTSTDLTGDTSSTQQQQNIPIRIPQGPTLQTATPTGPTDQGPYIDSAGIRRPMTTTEREIYERERRWRQMLAEPETDFQKLVRSLLGERLQVYGRKLFLVGPDTFSPVDQAPVTPDYVIGPGDE